MTTTEFVSAVVYHLPMLAVKDKKEILITKACPEKSVTDVAVFSFPLFSVIPSDLF